MAQHKKLRLFFVLFSKRTAENNGFIYRQRLRGAPLLYLLCRCIAALNTKGGFLCFRKPIPLSSDSEYVW